MCPLNYDDLHRIFKKLDKNGDGLINIKEFMFLLERIGVQASIDELETLVGTKCLDLIDFSFFYDIIIKRSVDNPQRKSHDDEEHSLESDLIKAFRMFDLNNDGFISCEELQRALSRLDLWDEYCLGSSDCRSMIRAYDTNLDGLLDFEEFKNMMSRTSS